MLSCRHDVALGFVKLPGMAERGSNRTLDAECSGEIGRPFAVRHFLHIPDAHSVNSLLTAAAVHSCCSSMVLVAADYICSAVDNTICLCRIGHKMTCTQPKWHSLQQRLITLRT